jgi:hypothetical protein
MTSIATSSPVTTCKCCNETCISDDETTSADHYHMCALQVKAKSSLILLASFMALDLRLNTAAASAAATAAAAAASTDATAAISTAVTVATASTHATAAATAIATAATEIDSSDRQGNNYVMMKGPS